MTTKILAHRGASACCPENSLPAFEKAVEVGADGVEFDVQLSRDGVPVVIHDEILDRTTTGSGLVGEKTIEELQKLELKKEASKNSGDSLSIPTLTQVLEVVKEMDLINIELKNFLSAPGLEKKVIEAVKEFSLKNKIIISSFNHNSIKKVKEIAPDIEAGFLMAARMIAPAAYLLQHGIEDLNIYYLSLTDEILQEIKVRGLNINVYTVDEKTAIKKMLESGVDTIITNYPERALEQKNS